MPRPAFGALLVVAAIAGFVLVAAGLAGFNPLVLGPLSAMLLVGVLALEQGKWLFRFIPLAYLGDASYSIYLWHTLAISVVMKASGLLSLPAATAIALSIAAGVAIGIACHEFLEKPIADYLKARRLRQKVGYAV